MKFVDCTLERHGEAILGIFNHAIEHSTALYEYKQRSSQDMAAWFADKAAGRYPVLGAETEQGALMGFASYGVFRAKPAYKYSVEHSVYVHEGHRGHGVGEALMRRLLVRAAEQQYHTLVGGIDMANAASIALHEKLGFKHTGTIAQAGFKFGRWLDLGFFQLMLSTPTTPVDG
jgi:L-amino acid N-acyltransferase